MPSCLLRGIATAVSGTQLATGVLLCLSIRMITLSKFGCADESGKPVKVRKSLSSYFALWHPGAPDGDVRAVGLS